MGVAVADRGQSNRAGAQRRPQSQSRPPPPHGRLARAGTAFPIGPRCGAPPSRAPRECAAARCPRRSRSQPARRAFERRREAASAMASPGRLLCVLGLLLCGAASLRLSRPHGDTAKKPIIGKEAVRGRSIWGGAGCRCWAPPAAALQLSRPAREKPQMCLAFGARRTPGWVPFGSY